jgi:hypothetical protein
MGETSLHESIKRWYTKPGDKMEAWVDGYLVDIVRDNMLIEIQTRGFSAIRDKLTKLIKDYRVLLVHPVAHQKWIVRLNSQGERISRRRSPRRGRVEDLFLELVYMPSLMKDPNMSIAVLLVHSEEVLIDDGKGSWRRRGWSVKDRKLVKVVDQIIYQDPSDLLELLPKDLQKKFTNRELAEALDLRLAIAQKMTYSLSRMEAIVASGKRGKATLFTIA